MQTQTELKLAQSNYYSATYDAINAKIDWLKATGKPLTKTNYKTVLYATIKNYWTDYNILLFYSVAVEVKDGTAELNDLKQNWKK